jgi:hypothetical protein
MKRRYFTIAVVLAAVVLVCSTILAPGAVAGPPDGDPPPDHGVVKEVLTTLPEIPEDWVVVRDETYAYHDKEGRLVRVREAEYLAPPSPKPQCEQCGTKAYSRAYYCSYWSSGSDNKSNQVGGVTQHLVTYYTRYHWTGPGSSPGDSAWYLDHSDVWWTRSSTAWSTGQTHVFIADTAGSVDCYNNKKTYGEYNDWFTPYWYSNDRTYTYRYITSGRGILASPPAKRRTHRVGPTPVELYGNYYGTLPSLQNQYWIGGH